MASPSKRDKVFFKKEVVQRTNSWLAESHMWRIPSPYSPIVVSECDIELASVLRVEFAGKRDISVSLIEKKSYVLYFHLIPFVWLVIPIHLRAPDWLKSFLVILLILPPQFMLTAESKMFGGSQSNTSPDSLLSTSLCSFTQRDQEIRLCVSTWCPPPITEVRGRRWKERRKKRE